MLFNYKQWQFRPDSGMTANSAYQLEGLALFKRFIKHHFFIILLVTVCVNGLGLIYLVSTQPRFTATAVVLIDTRKGGALQQQSGLGEITIDIGMIDTQIIMLKSERISLSVIKDLRLTEDKEFIGSDGGFTGKVIRFISDIFGKDELIDALLSELFSLQKPTGESELERAALGEFAQNTAIKRIGMSYMIEISFTSLDGEKAARIANAIVGAYIADRLEARNQATSRATMWLQDRVKELSIQASAQGRAVVEFKERNNILNTNGINGRLLIEQQLAELSTQLTVASTATVAAKARFERIQEIMKQEIPDESVTDALGNSVIVRLRGQYLDMKARETRWSENYGSNHLVVLDLQKQMQIIRVSMVDELRRISESYRSEYDIVKAQEEAVKNKLASRVLELQSSNRAQIQLQQLEIGAQAYRALYDNFLQRYTESLQQQSFPTTEVRIVSLASRHWQKTHPKVLIILAASFVASVLLGLGVAMLREL